MDRPDMERVIHFTLPLDKYEYIYENSFAPGLTGGKIKKFIDRNHEYEDKLREKLLEIQEPYFKVAVTTKCEEFLNKNPGVNPKQVGSEYFGPIYRAILNPRGGGFGDDEEKRAERVALFTEVYDKANEDILKALQDFIKQQADLEKKKGRLGNLPKALEDAGIDPSDSRYDIFHIMLPDLDLSHITVEDYVKHFAKVMPTKSEKKEAATGDVKDIWIGVKKVLLQPKINRLIKSLEGKADSNSQIKLSIFKALQKFIDTDAYLSAGLSAQQLDDIIPVPVEEEGGSELVGGLSPRQKQTIWDEYEKIKDMKVPTGNVGRLKQRPEIRKALDEMNKQVLGFSQDDLIIFFSTLEKINDVKELLKNYADNDTASDGLSEDLSVKYLTLFKTIQASSFVPGTTPYEPQGLKRITGTKVLPKKTGERTPTTPTQGTLYSTKTEPKKTALQQKLIQLRDGLFDLRQKTGQLQAGLRALKAKLGS